MAHRGLPPFVGSTLASLALAALLVCGLAGSLAGIGFHLDGWTRWAGYVRAGIQAGQGSDTVGGVVRAMPTKVDCGSRWLMAQPGFARMHTLEQQDRLDEAASVCQRIAQDTLGCVPTTSVTAQCFQLDKKIVIRECLSTCSPVMCKAARMPCGR